MSKKLLLADDSVVIQKLVGLSFANEDVDLITTDNGDDALAKAREHKPDAILADVVMPGMSGYEVCEAIKSDPELQNTPVLLLTGTFEAFDESRAEDVGSDGHITKPFEAQALVDRVNALFAAARPAAAAAAPAGSGSDDAFDFFEDGTSDLSADAGTDITRTASAAEAGPLLSGAGGPSDSAFDFGVDDSDPLANPDLLGEPIDLDRGLAEPDDEATMFVGGIPSPAPSSPSADLHADSSGAIDLDTLAPRPLDRTADLPVDDFLDSDDAAPETHTTVIMSEGDSSSAGLSLGSDSRGASGMRDEEMAAEETVLAEDLFTPTPAPVAATPVVAPAPATVPDFDADDDLDSDLDTEIDAGMDADMSSSLPSLGSPGDTDEFEFDDDDASDAASHASPASSASESGSVPPLADDYDVSSSDLGDPFVVRPQPIVDLDDEVPVENEPSGISISPGMLGTSMGAPPVPAAAPLTPAPVAAASAAPSSDRGGPDITPVMRDRIHETLEKVAWEAFADLSETMVKQVLERVESVAWEVIPQMAEALIKEEIRRMKGDDEE